VHLIRLSILKEVINTEQLARRYVNIIGESNALHDTYDELKTKTYDLLQKDTPQLILQDLFSSSVAWEAPDHNSNIQDTSIVVQENGRTTTTTTTATGIVDTTHNKFQTKDDAAAENNDIVRLATNNETLSTNCLYNDTIMLPTGSHRHEQKNNNNEESAKTLGINDDIIHFPSNQNDDNTHSIVSSAKRLCDLAAIDTPTFHKRHKTFHLNDRQRQRNILLKTRRLFELYHASKCAQEICYESKHCAEMKQLWNHMEHCSNNDPCQYPHCQSSRSVLTHYQACPYKRCPICSSFRFHMTNKMIESNRHKNMCHATGTVFSSLVNPTTTTPELSSMS
jgi:TAZ zinc finger